jgi:2-polyprenyl-6-methoxyphenol hydroxylase-like FAD-dependent oxidoreductase
MSTTRKTRCCIAGGGPAGLMLGFLLARAGIEVVVLEKHADFLRDFRGDTVHPSTLTVMDELGLLERFLRLPHQRLDRIEGVFGEDRVQVADFRRLPVKAPYIAFMPQWDFLDFLAGEARRLPNFTLLMQAEAQALRRRDGRVAGIVARTPAGEIEIDADLTVGADGRGSAIRTDAGLRPRALGAPMDVLWFRVARDPSDGDEALMRVRDGRILVTLDRGDYWQCAYVIPKGGADAVRARGLPALREDVAAVEPVLRAALEDVRSWDDVKLLTVTVDRLERWHLPGLLFIGDAAHAMSPIGGVGINLAIQDAVAAHNLLVPALRGDAAVAEEALAAVQRRRWRPTVFTQRMQTLAQDALIAPVLQGQRSTRHAPLPLRIVSHSGLLQGLMARVVGTGLRPEHLGAP